MRRFLAILAIIAGASPLMASTAFAQPRHHHHAHHHHVRHVAQRIAH
jgi:hypothetical protein